MLFDEFLVVPIAAEDSAVHVADDLPEPVRLLVDVAAADGLDQLVVQFLQLPVFSDIVFSSRAPSAASLAAAAPVPMWRDAAKRYRQQPSPSGSKPFADYTLARAFPSWQAGAVREVRIPSGRTIREVDYDRLLLLNASWC